MTQAQLTIAQVAQDISQAEAQAETWMTTDHPMLQETLGILNDWTARVEGEEARVEATKQKAQDDLTNQYKAYIHDSQQDRMLWLRKWWQRTVPLYTEVHSKIVLVDVLRFMLLLLLLPMRGFAALTNGMINLVVSVDVWILTKVEGGISFLVAGVDLALIAGQKTAKVLLQGAQVVLHYVKEIVIAICKAIWMGITGTFDFILKTIVRAYHFTIKTIKDTVQITVLLIIATKDFTIRSAKAACQFSVSTFVIVRRFAIEKLMAAGAFIRSWAGALRDAVIGRITGIGETIMVIGDDLRHLSMPVQIILVVMILAVILMFFVLLITII